LAAPSVSEKARSVSAVLQIVIMIFPMRYSGSVDGHGYATAQRSSGPR
jgi:hypothetical protein